MAFVLKPTDNVGKEITRIGSEQLGDAIQRLTNPDDLKRNIHEARKCLKRSRALLALSQPALSGKRFEREDKRIRKIARNLARARDTHAMMEAVEKLRAGNRILPAADHLKKEIGARVAHVNRGLDDETLARVVDRLKKAQNRFARLKLKNRWDMIERGMANTYRQARKSYRLASKTGEAEAFHEWRKPMQRHWRQMQLFMGTGNPIIAARVEAAQRLSQLLGDDHDLHMLVEAINSGKMGFANDAERDDLLAACQRQLDRLRDAARKEGEILFAPKPREFRAMFANQIGKEKPGQGLNESFPATQAEAIAGKPASVSGQPDPDGGTAAG